MQRIDIKIIITSSPGTSHEKTRTLACTVQATTLHAIANAFRSWLRHFPEATFTTDA